MGGQGKERAREGALALFNFTCISSSVFKAEPLHAPSLSVSLSLSAAGDVVYHPPRNIAGTAVRITTRCASHFILPARKLGTHEYCSRLDLLGTLETTKSTRVPWYCTRALLVLRLVPMLDRPFKTPNIFSK